MMFNGLNEGEKIACELLHAIVTMNVTRARHAFDKGADPKMRDIDFPIAWQLIRRWPEGATLLQDAVLLSSERRMQGDRMDMIDLLLEKGCPIHGANYDGYTALHNAALVDHAPAAKRLIEEGALVDSQSLKGYTSLQTAMNYESHNVVAILLSNDAKTGLVNHRGEDALDYCSRLNNPEALAMIQSAQARRSAMLALQEIQRANSLNPPPVSFKSKTQSSWQPPSPYATKNAKGPRS